MAATPAALVPGIGLRVDSSRVSPPQIAALIGAGLAAGMVGPSAFEKLRKQ
ncbi:hypothetical protein [Devosia sp.]|uniref:hypothetical protein n=1 Tax=Devosia sp. TaxID=1871048 RepID=UPI00387E763C